MKELFFFFYLGLGLTKNRQCYINYFNRLSQRRKTKLNPEIRALISY